MNPLAFVFWALCTCIGFLIGQTLIAAVAGLTVGLAASLIVDTILLSRG